MVSLMVSLTVWFITPVRDCRPQTLQPCRPEKEKALCQSRLREGKGRSVRGTTFVLPDVRQSHWAFNAGRSEAATQK